MSFKCYSVYAKTGNNCKFIIIQLTNLFLSKIFISTDSDTIIMPDITSKLCAGVIFLIYTLGGGTGEMYI